MSRATPGGVIWEREVAETGIVGEAAASRVELVFALGKNTEPEAPISVYEIYLIRYQ